MLYDFIEEKEELIQLLAGELLPEVIEVRIWMGGKRGRFPWGTIAIFLRKPRLLKLLNKLKTIPQLQFLTSSDTLPVVSSVSPRGGREVREKSVPIRASTLAHCI